MTEPPADISEDSSDKESKRLTPAQWEEIVTLWELGEVKLEELAARFGISSAAISKGLKKRRAIKGSKSKEVAAKVAAVTIESAIDASELRLKRIEETKRQHYEWSTLIAKLAMAELAKAQREERPFSTVDANLKALRKAAAIIAEMREERYAILDAHTAVDENTLPSLVIRDLTEEELEELRKRSEEEEGFLEPELPKEIEEIVSEGE